jgi:hypothetical protein
MQRRILAFSVVLFLLGALGAPISSQAEPGRAPDPGGRGLEVYVGQIAAADVEKLRLAGLDHEDVRTSAASGGKVAVEVVMNGRQAAALAADGIALSVKQVNGKPASRVAVEENRAGYEGFRSWSERGGIADELRQTARSNPKVAELVEFGTTVQGKSMLAVRVTADATKVADGSRPAVMYLGAQHAREWITPEMVRRLMHHFIDGYGTDDQITRLMDTTEFWFVPVANPDGYDHTFTGDNRLWRKNLQDNDDDGAITGNDGVDLNRNWATKWGWDNEGSSPQPSSQTFRGSGPTSEPESQGLEDLFDRVGFEHFVTRRACDDLTQAHRHRAGRQLRGAGPACRAANGRRCVWHERAPRNRDRHRPQREDRFRLCDARSSRGERAGDIDPCTGCRRHFAPRVRR